MGTDLLPSRFRFSTCPVYCAILVANDCSHKGFPSTESHIFIIPIRRPSLSARWIKRASVIRRGIESPDYLSDKLWLAASCRLNWIRNLSSTPCGGQERGSISNFHASSCFEPTFALQSFEKGQYNENFR